MILEQLIQRVESNRSNGVESYTAPLRARHIYNKLVTARNLLVFQKANKRQFIGSWAYSTLHCVEMIAAPLSECPCAPPVGCTFLRSKYKLPKILSDLNGEIIKSVSDLDGNVIFSKTSWNEKKYKKGNKYTKNNPDYYIRNGYLYITTSNTYRMNIAVEAIFENPIDVIEFQSVCGNDSFFECLSYMEIDFPIDPTLEEALVGLALEELAGKNRNQSGEEEGA